MVRRRPRLPRRSPAPRTHSAIAIAPSTAAPIATSTWVAVNEPPNSEKVTSFRSGGPVLDGEVDDQSGRREPEQDERDAHRSPPVFRREVSTHRGLCPCPVLPRHRLGRARRDCLGCTLRWPRSRPPKRNGPRSSAGRIRTCRTRARSASSRRSPGASSAQAPFGRPGAFVLRRYGYPPWEKNPKICGRCFKGLGDRRADVPRRARGRQEISGAEVELSMLFADVRGSSKLARQMPALRFHPADEPLLPVSKRGPGRGRRDHREVRGRRGRRRCSSRS